MTLVFPFHSGRAGAGHTKLRKSAGVMEMVGLSNSLGGHEGEKKWVRKEGGREKDGEKRWERKGERNREKPQSK